MKNRNPYVDSLRGLAIIGVVAIHSTKIGEPFKRIDFDFFAAATWQQIVNFSVPLFLSISGYFMANKSWEEPGSYQKFITNQLSKILIPYIFWSIIYLTIDYFGGMSLKRLLFRFVTFQSAVPFYFIFLIIQYYLLLPLLQKLGNNRGLLISGFVSLTACCLIFLLRINLDTKLNILLYAGCFPTWLFFYVLGIYIRRNPINLTFLQAVLMVLCGFVLSLFETYVEIFSVFTDVDNAISAVKIGSFAYSGALIVFLFNRLDTKISLRSQMLEYLGQISFGIYFCHLLFLKMLAKVISNNISVFESYALASQLLAVVGTLLVCTAVISISRTIHKGFATQYLGF